jgi:hypothetical protein
MSVTSMPNKQGAASRMGNLRLALALTAALTITTLFLTAKYRQLYLTVPDNVGYMQASYQLAHGKGLAFADPHNRLGAQYYTLHTFRVFRHGEPNRYFDYPPGLPLLAASAEILTQNPDAVHLVVPLMAAMLVASVCVLGALFGGPWMGFWAGFLLLSTSTFLTFSTSLWSEIPSAALLYVGCALHITSATIWPSGSKKAIVLSLLGGLAIGATFFIRFSNLSVLPVIVPLALYGTRDGDRPWGRSLALGGGIIFAAAALLIFNTIYYGGPFTTAYTPKHGWYTEPAFSLAYAFGKSFAGGYSALAMGKALLRDFGWFLPLALVGVFTFQRRAAVLLLSLIGFLLLPYLVYAFSAEGLNARFVLPAWPAICLLIGQGIVFLLSKLPRAVWRWGVGLLLAVSLVYDLPSQIAEQVERNQASQRTVEQVVQLSALTEPDAVILSYLYNDLFAVYGARSVLNYRHIIPYDPASDRYLLAEFEPILVGEIEHLLDQGISTYYIQDREPALYDIDKVLKKHFSLVPVGDGNVVWRITR